jgi:hypothetical protein
MYGRTRKVKVKPGKRPTKGRKAHGGQVLVRPLHETEEKLGLRRPTLLEEFKALPGKLDRGSRKAYENIRRVFGLSGGGSCGLYGGSNCQYTGGKRRRRKTQKKRSHRKH